MTVFKEPEEETPEDRRGCMMSALLVVLAVVQKVREVFE